MTLVQFLTASGAIEWAWLLWRGWVWCGGFRRRFMWAVCGWKRQQWRTWNR